MDFRELGRSAGIEFSPENWEAITKKISEWRHRRAKIGVFGKTGVGKSSLCNALFGQDVCAVSDIEACTRERKSVQLQFGNKEITLVDVPGVGESIDRDIEYNKLYSDLIPKLDAIFWVLKADDRAYKEDFEWYENVVKPLTNFKANFPIIFVLNQIDKIAPHLEWDVKERIPGLAQRVNIDKKINAVANGFKVPGSEIIPVSANEKYNLEQLVRDLIFKLPDDLKLNVLTKVNDDIAVDQKTRDVAEKGMVVTALEFVEKLKLPIPMVAFVAKAARKFVQSIWGKNGPCYITTASLAALGKGDDCYELSMFRSFRDHWLCAQPNGTLIIEQYYRTAPKIVAVIDRLGNKSQIYSDIWTTYLSKCLKSIENVDYEACKSRYVEMVNTLEKRYL